jgi:anti-sigma regulatory factor (Ser/Thr protein kinase)
MTREHSAIEIMQTTNLLAVRSVGAVPSPPSLKAWSTPQPTLAAVSDATLALRVVGAPDELLFCAFDRIARRGEGASSWAAPLGGDPIAFLLDSMSDAANLWRADGALLYRNRASLALGTIVTASAPAGLSGPAGVIEVFEVQGQRYERRCLRCGMRATPYVVEVIRELARSDVFVKPGHAWPDSSSDERMATVAHELRGRLHVLTLNSHGLLSAAHAIGTELPRAWLRDRLERLDRALHSMRELMERLLEVQHRQLSSVAHPQVDLRAIVLEVLQSDNDALRSAGCTCEFAAPEPVKGHWDALQLRVAIGNLVSNALKFGAGRPIAIKVGVEDATAFVRVIDQGSGVQPEDCERIFERFERAGGGAHGHGWGLGLWLARNIARAHGGDVTLRSVPGEGAAFTVCLPVQRSDT